MIEAQYKNRFKFEPYNDVEAKKWLEAYLGSSLIKTVSRTKYTAKVIVNGEGGVERETIISLPRRIIQLP